MLFEFAVAVCSVLGLLFLLDWIFGKKVEFNGAHVVVSINER